MNDLNDTDRVHIVRECERVFLQIARLTDHGPHDAIAQHFTEDAQMDRDGTPVRGRAALQALYAKRPANLMTRHLVSSMLVTPVSAREAVCRAIATVYRHRGPDAATPPAVPVTCAGPESIVEYEDRLVRTDDGWKVSSRVMKTVIKVQQG